jgi:hypothetical protein
MPLDRPAKRLSLNQRPTSLDHLPNCPHPHPFPGLAHICTRASEIEERSENEAQPTDMRSGAIALLTPYQQPICYTPCLCDYERKETFGRQQGISGANPRSTICGLRWEFDHNMLEACEKVPFSVAVEDVPGSSLDNRSKSLTTDHLYSAVRSIPYGGASH